MTLSIATLLAESALRRPAQAPVVIGPSSTTYAELWEQARRYGAVLRERGVGPGDRVALMLPNVPDFPRAYYGALAVGAVVVPVHALLSAQEIAYVLTDSGAKLFVCAAPLLGEGAKGGELAGVGVLSVLDGGDASVERLDTLAADVAPIDSYVSREPDDDAVILYTSGTTGKPKGAVLTQLNMVLNASLSATDIIELCLDDVVLGCLPLFHSFGQTCAMNAAFRVGATLVMLPRFDGATALDMLINYSVTVFEGVPTMYLGLLDAARTDDRRPNLRLAVSGGAALPAAVLEKFKEVFGVEVEIAKAELDNRIELLPRGELGELVIRGHNVMKGYLNNPEATAAAIVDGWFRTGDLGTKDDEGFITIVDRKKDMVLRGGYNVYPREVEEVLLRHDAVAQVAVIAVPDPQLGEDVCAVVVRSPEAEGSDEELGAAIITWSKDRMAKYKYPRRVEFVEAMPLGPSGKVLKRELVERYA